jgi:hypothetical protein
LLAVKQYQHGRTVLKQQQDGASDADFFGHGFYVRVSLDAFSAFKPQTR